MTDTRRDRDSNGYVGIRDHGSSRAAVPRDPRRAKSWVWGGKAVAILNEHGATAVWDPCFSQGGRC